MPDMLGDLAAEIRDLMRRIRVLESASPIGQSSVSEGALEIRSNEGLLVDGSAKVNGWLVVTGTERVTGRLEGSGTFDWTGPMNLKGAQNVTGPTTFVGNVDITGPLNVLGTWKLTGNGEIVGDVDLKGILRLLNDLLVKSGGRIVIEGADQIVLEQSGGVARMRMGASEIRGGDGIGLYPNSGPSIISTSAGLRIASLPTVSGATPNVYMDAQGFLRRIT